MTFLQLWELMKKQQKRHSRMCEVQPACTEPERICWFIHTGASVSVLDEDWARSHHVKLQKTSKGLKGPGETRLTVLGCFEAELEYNGKSMKETFICHKGSKSRSSQQDSMHNAWTGSSCVNCQRLIVAAYTRFQSWISQSIERSWTHWSEISILNFSQAGRSASLHLHTT